jgi:glycerophosphoryl diester phosphodiesterase
VLSLDRRDGRPLVIGHRGAAALAPENTIGSLRAAHAAGVDIIEFDVLALASRELVLAHSGDLREVTHGTVRGRVRALTLEQLREFAPELPTYEEALEFFVDEATDVGVHIDVKSAGCEHEIAAGLARFGLAERTLASSFHPAVVRRLGTLEPRVRVAISFPQDRMNISGRRGSGTAVRFGLRCVRPIAPQLVARLLARSGGSTIAIHHSLATPAVVQRAHRLGAKVVAWTLLHRLDLVRVDAAGVDAVVVDDPGLFGLGSA